MEKDPLQLLDSLGSLEEYREIGEVKEYVKKVRSLMEELQAEYEKQPSEASRCVYLLDVLKKMIEVARHKACACDLHCKNVDIFYVMDEWVNFSKNKQA